MLFYQLAHIVQAGLLDGSHKLGGLQSPLGEDLPGEGGVLDFHDLVVACEDNLVLPMISDRSYFALLIAL